MFNLYEVVKTKNDIKYKNIIIPKGTHVIIIEKYDDWCIVEFCDGYDNKKYPDIEELKYTELEKINKDTN